jgi:hypothetical protein
MAYVLNRSWEDLLSHTRHEEFDMPSNVLISPNNDIRTTPDSLDTPGNGRSDNWCDANDSLKGVSTKADNETKSLRIVTINDILICSDQDFFPKLIMELGVSQNPRKSIAAALMAVAIDSQARSSQPKLIAMEDNRDGNETQQIESRLKLIVLRDNPDGNEIW